MPSILKWIGCKIRRLLEILLMQTANGANLQVLEGCDMGNALNAAQIKIYDYVESRM